MARARKRRTPKQACVACARDRLVFSTSARLHHLCGRLICSMPLRWIDFCLACGRSFEIDSLIDGVPSTSARCAKKAFCLALTGSTARDALLVLGET